MGDILIEVANFRLRVTMIATWRSSPATFLFAWTPKLVRDQTVEEYSMSLPDGQPDPEPVPVPEREPVPAPVAVLV
jgi:hypothetical protein